MARISITKPFETFKQADKSGLFMHVCKCGGTSVDQVFRQYSNLHVSLNEGTLHANMPGFNIVYGPGVIQEHFDFTFAFVRNPFDRLAAMWEVYKQRRVEGITIDFILHIAGLSGLPHDRRRRCASDHELWRHIRPAAWYPLDQLDAVFRLEDIDLAWQEVQFRLGFSCPLPRANKSGMTVEKRRKLFNPSQVERVKKLYATDLDTYGYEF